MDMVTGHYNDRLAMSIFMKLSAEEKAALMREISNEYVAMIHDQEVQIKHDMDFLEEYESELEKLL